MLALFIPMRDPQKPDHSLLRDLEKDLHTLVTFVILPLFAFANAGISLHGSNLSTLLHPVPMGIAAGLFIGKQMGVFLFCLAGISLGLARLPEGASLRGLYGVAMLCGVGFTMSLFIGSLAFDNTGLELTGEQGMAMLFDERLGILLGSLTSGLSGYLILRNGAFRY
jgi:NhaA family Na+:H+ antiporter